MKLYLTVSFKRSKCTLEAKLQACISMAGRGNSDRFKHDANLDWTLLGQLGLIFEKDDII